MAQAATTTDDTKNDALRDSLWTVLVPVVRLLVRNGIQFHDMASALTYTYLDEGRKFLQSVGLPATEARLQLLTGINRKQVAMFLSNAMQPHDQSTDPDAAFKAGRVLTAWVTEPKYVMPMVGTPLDLPIDGPPGTASFRSLVSEHAPSIDFGTLLEEFIRLGNVRMLEEYGTVRVLKREYLPGTDSPAQIMRLATSARSFVETLELNLRKEGPGKGIFERAVHSNFPVSPDDARDFDALLRAQGQTFLQELDQWLSERTPDLENGRHIGAEIFYFSEDPKSFVRDSSDAPPPPVAPRDTGPIEIDLLDPLLGKPAHRKPR